MCHLSARRRYLVFVTALLPIFPSFVLSGDLVLKLGSVQHYRPDLPECNSGLNRLCGIVEIRNVGLVRLGCAILRDLNGSVGSDLMSIL